MQRSVWKTADGRKVQVLDPEDSSETPDWAGFWQRGQIICIQEPDEKDGDPYRSVIDRPPADWEFVSGDSDFDESKKSSKKGSDTETALEKAANKVAEEAEAVRVAAEVEGNVGTAEERPERPDKPDNDGGEPDDVVVARLLTEQGLSMPKNAKALAELGLESVGGGNYSVTAGGPRVRIKPKTAALRLALERRVQYGA